jgi:ribosome-associated protein
MAKTTSQRRTAKNTKPERVKKVAKTETVAKATKSPRLPKAISVAIEAAQDRKASGVVVLDLKKAGAFTDYFVICSASNPRQVQAIADAIEEALKAQKQRPSLVEGYSRAEWILLDYFDFVIHVFSKHARDFYGLDRLWGSATRHEFPDVA